MLHCQILSTVNASTFLVNFLLRFLVTVQQQHLLKYNSYIIKEPFNILLQKYQNRNKTRNKYL